MLLTMDLLDADAGLMLRYRDGDAAAFSALYLDSPPLEPEVPEYQRPDRLAEFVEQQFALLAAVAALPPEQREAFLLREETGLSIEEIARVTADPRDGFRTTRCKKSR
jgi:DNA-directed RNA polymerase specialized sigma24 family protein